MHVHSFLRLVDATLPRRGFPASFRSIYCTSTNTFRQRTTHTEAAICVCHRVWRTAKRNSVCVIVCLPVPVRVHSYIKHIYLHVKASLLHNALHIHKHTHNMDKHLCYTYHATLITKLFCKHETSHGWVALAASLALGCRWK